MVGTDGLGRIVFLYTGPGRSPKPGCLTPRSRSCLPCTDGHRGTVIRGCPDLQALHSAREVPPAVRAGSWSNP